MDENNVELAKLEEIKAEFAYFREYLCDSQDFIHNMGEHITEINAPIMFREVSNHFDYVIRMFDKFETEITTILVEEEA